MDQNLRPNRLNAILNGAIICIVLGVLFGVSWYFFGDSDLRSPQTFFFGVGFGVYVGFAALPFFAPKTYKPRPVICTIIAVAVGGAAAFSYDLSPSLSVILILVAGVVGYFAPKWIKHVQF
jgi:uncharacterized membrane protein YccC